MSGREEIAERFGLSTDETARLGGDEEQMTLQAAGVAHGHVIATLLHEKQREGEQFVAHLAAGVPIGVETSR